MLAIIWAVIIGAFAGSLGKMILPGSRPSGIAVTVLLGVMGALLSGALAAALGATPGTYGSILGQVAGALLFVFAPGWALTRHPHHQH